MIWIPNTISELVDERIEFCAKFVDSYSKIPDVERKRTRHSYLQRTKDDCLSEFTKALLDLKDLKSILNMFSDNPNDDRVKGRLKWAASKFLFEMAESIKAQKIWYTPMGAEYDLMELNTAIVKMYNNEIMYL